jgi:hypothetical protein
VRQVGEPDVRRLANNSNCCPWETPAAFKPNASLAQRAVVAVAARHHQRSRKKKSFAHRGFPLLHDLPQHPGECSDDGTACPSGRDHQNFHQDLAEHVAERDGNN